MKRLRQGMVEVYRVLGWPGLTGVACIGALAVVALGLSPGWLDEAAELDAMADRLQARQRAQKVQLTHAAVSPAQSTPQAWINTLPEMQAQQERLVDLLELGMRQGVQVARTEHRMSTDASSGLVRLRVTMPVKGSYVQIRGFVAAALKADAALSLDALKMRRASIQASELEGELQWSLLSRYKEASP